MAASLVGGSALGAVFGELLKAVLDMKDKATMFKQTLATLQSILVAISPAIDQIAQHNNELGHPKQELEPLIRDMEKGTKLVCGCSKIHKLNFVARVRYQEQLQALMHSLMIFFAINMQAYNSRDQREQTLNIRRILSRVYKLPLVSTDTTDSSSDFVPMSGDNSENATETNSTEEVMELISQVTGSLTSNSDPVLMDVNESETPRSNTTLTGKNAASIDSAKQATEPIMTSITQEVDQSAVEAESSQATQQLMNEDSYDQCTAERRFFGICLPKIKPMLPMIGVFNRQVMKDTFGSPSSYYRSPGCSYNFELKDLIEASVELLEKGKFGVTYKAKLDDGTTLVVKRLDKNVMMVGETKFDQQMKMMQRLSQHPNVVPLLACYYTRDENVLIYDYLAADNFSRLLHETEETGLTALDWNSRLKISLGVAKGIAHINSASEGKLVHGNINSSNILVTADLQGYISNFGLASFFSPSIPFSGNEGYQAPEIIGGKNLTTKSDVYSFGILLLEMLTGKTPALKYRSVVGMEIDLPTWVKCVILEEGIGQVFDVELQRYVNRGKEMERLLNWALRCVESMPHYRPSMDEVVSFMEGIRASNEG